MQTSESSSPQATTAPQAAKPVREVFAGAFSGGGASGGLFVGGVIHPQDKAGVPPTGAQG